MRKLSMVVVMFVVLLTAAGARAQNYNWLSENPSAVTQANLDKQVEVLLQLYSSLAGSGFINTASLHKVGGIDVRATFVGTPVPDEFKDIIPTVPNPLDSSVNFVPFAFLHGNIGLPANFEVYGRFFTLPTGGDPGGNVTLLGGGLKYGLLRGNLAAPDITIMAGYQTVLVPDDFDFGTISTLSVKAYLSKKITFITLYGGGGFDRTTLKLKLDEIPLPPGLFKEKYDVNYPQGTVGFMLSPIPLLNINADLNLGELTSFTIGASLSVR